MSNRNINMDADVAAMLIRNITDAIIESNSAYDWSSTLAEDGVTYTCNVIIAPGSRFLSGGEVIYTVNLKELYELGDDIYDDEDALIDYLDERYESIDYDDRGSEYYTAAEKAAEERFGCLNAFLEPSTQIGRGGLFLFADNMRFTGSADYETAEEYIQSGDKDGFIEYVLSCIMEDDEDNDEDDI